EAKKSDRRPPQGDVVFLWVQKPTPLKEAATTPAGRCRTAVGCKNQRRSKKQRPPQQGDVVRLLGAITNAAQTNSDHPSRAMSVRLLVAITIAAQTKRHPPPKSHLII
ncbi:hypothetical protein, partial [Cupriavidus basilensis]|uniref:hypothetical protein n=1 Tax=Cupriavidus basilensis TaxID=68895 RepID=UPI0023E7E2AF